MKEEFTATIAMAVDTVDRRELVLLGIRMVISLRCTEVHALYPIVYNNMYVTTFDLLYYLLYYVIVFNNNIVHRSHLKIDIAIYKTRVP